jgi:ethanolamine utilization protein EutN
VEKRVMEFAIVLGTIVATVKDPALIGVLFLLLQPITHIGEKYGNPIIGVDTDQNAGPGDIVIFVHSPDASMAFPGDIWGPVDAAVVAIVDHVDIEGKVTIKAGQEWKLDV